MPKPARLGNVPIHFFFGARGWDANYVFWGSRGPGNKAALEGRYVELIGAGAPPKDVETFCTVSLTGVTATYALFREDRLVYVGEGELGTRLRQHWFDPDLLWDRFSWIAPGQYEYGNDKAAVTQATTVSIGNAITPKALCEFLETIAIAFGKPIANSQVPEDQGISTLWLDQVMHPQAKGRIEDQLEQIAEDVRSLKGQSK